MHLSLHVDFGDCVDRRCLKSDQGLILKRQTRPAPKAWNAHSCAHGRLHGVFVGRRCGWTQLQLVARLRRRCNSKQLNHVLIHIQAMHALSGTRA